MTTANKTLTVKSKGAIYTVVLTGDLDCLDVAISGAASALGMFDAGGLDCGDSNSAMPVPAFEKIHDAIEDFVADARLDAEEE